MIRSYAEMWKTPAGGAEVKTKVQEEPGDSHISDKKYFIFYVIFGIKGATCANFEALRLKCCCYSLFLHLY